MFSNSRFIDASNGYTQKPKPSLLDETKTSLLSGFSIHPKLAELQESINELRLPMQDTSNAHSGPYRACATHLASHQVSFKDIITSISDINFHQALTVSNHFERGLRCEDFKRWNEFNDINRYDFSFFNRVDDLMKLEKCQPNILMLLISNITQKAFEDLYNNRRNVNLQNLSSTELTTIIEALDRIKKAELQYETYGSMLSALLEFIASSDNKLKLLQNTVEVLTMRGSSRTLALMQHYLNGFDTVFAKYVSDYEQRRKANQDDVVHDSASLMTAISDACSEQKYLAENRARFK